jgi:hypothetical protein
MKNVYPSDESSCCVGLIKKRVEFATSLSYFFPTCQEALSVPDFVSQLANSTIALGQAKMVHKMVLKKAIFSAIL